MRTEADFAHVIIEISTPEGVLPFLIIDTPNGGSIMLEQVALVRRRAEQGYSPSQLNKLTESIGRFYDWIQLTERDPITTPDDLPPVIKRFLTARDKGTVLTDGTDPTGLLWRPVKSQTVETDRRNLNQLSDFVATDLGYFPLNPDIRVDGYKQGGTGYKNTQFLLSARRQQLDMFGYLAPLRSPKRKRAVGPSGAHPRIQREDSGHAFPLDRLGDLITSERSIVKRMIYIELAFGGARISEALNHFVTDVLPGSRRKALFPDDNLSDLPLLVLADPIESIYTDSLAFSTEDRRQYLMRRFGIPPRPSRPSRHDSLHAGWKGMLYDNDNILISQIYWSHPEWARTYWELYKELLEIRRSIPKKTRESHPYLYVNDYCSRAEFGLPVKIHTIEKAFVRACKRIGLKPYRSKVSLHGLRHAYKQQLKLQGQPPEIIQRCMHHISIDSQAAYSKASASDINTALQSLRNVHEI